MFPGVFSVFPWILYAFYHFLGYSCASSAGSDLTAEQNPNSSVLGTDLSPIQPAYLPPNCRFEIDDVDDAWAYGHKFDYIHARYLLPFVKKDWNVLFKSAYDQLNPGGWVESQETIIYFQSVDGSIEGTALQRWNALLLQGIQRTGRSLSLIHI